MHVCSNSATSKRRGPGNLQQGGWYRSTGDQWGGLLLEDQELEEMGQRIQDLEHQEFRYRSIGQQFEKSAAAGSGPLPTE